MEKYSYLENILGKNQELPPESILSSSLMQTPHARAIMFHVAAGQELSEHTSTKPALLHFLSGEAEVTLGGDIKPAGPNTFVYMEPHLPHTIVAKTPVSMLLIMIETGK